MYFKEIEPHILETHLKVSKVLDGDSLKVVSMFGKYEKEIRLYGLDAPEIKRCRKLRKQELETQIPAELLLKLGRLSLDFVLSLAPPSTKVTLITEKANYIDFYGRQMGYIILPDGRCLNELLLSERFAKIET